jgi:hypothetical protein
MFYLFIYQEPICVLLCGESQVVFLLWGDFQVMFYYVEKVEFYLVLPLGLSIHAFIYFSYMETSISAI